AGQARQRARSRCDRGELSASVAAAAQCLVLGNRIAAMGREVLSPASRSGYNRRMSKNLFKIALLLISLVAATGADAQTRHRQQRQQREPKEVEHPIPSAPVDKRDSVVAGQGAYAGRPYWAALAQCGGIYFKLNTLYSDIAVHARAVKPDPKINAEYTKK